MHLDIWRDDPGEPADLEILLMGPVPQGQFIPQMQHITVPSADVPTNQWVSLEVPVPEGFEVQQVVMGLGEPGTGDFSSFIPPTAVPSDVYIGNLYFTDGDPVPAPSFVAPDAVDIGFSAEDEAELSIVPFGATGGVTPTATVKTSPNGVRRFEVVKDTGAVEWAGVAVTTLPGQGNYSLLTAEHTEMLVNVYAPAAGETVKFKLENSADATESVEADLVTTTAGWQTMRFDFTNHTDGTRLSIPLSCMTSSRFSRASATPVPDRPII